MKLSEDKRLDKRLVDRNLKQGLITQDEYDAYLKGLPDVIDHAAPLSVEMTDVGVADVDAIDTGETE
ncbi:MAG: hypothetical protein VX589_08740 [Myxococcota bacterium]|nr:hypothetical protein [Myxococcota bacterium]